MKVLSIDIGTTTVKGAVFSVNGALSVSLREKSPAMESDSGVRHELDPCGWKKAAFGIIRHLASEWKPDAIIVTGNGPTLFPVSETGDPLHPALIWLDKRAVKEAESAAAATGFPVDASFCVPKALWFRNNLPEIWEKTRWFFTPSDWLAWLLTGTPAVSIPSAYYERFFWNEEILAAAGLDPGKFPPVARPGVCLGTVSRLLSESLNLPSACKVYAGCPDFLAALVGSGTVFPGTALDRAGTSEALNCVMTSRLPDERLFSLPHLIEGLWNASGGLSTSGRAIDWISGIMGLSGIAETLSLAETGGKGPSLLFLPYLSGERSPLKDPDARGAFIGLSLEHGAGDMIFSVLESTAFGLRNVAEILASHNAAPDFMRISGRPSVSPFWVSLKADILGIPVETLEFPDAELTGSACLVFASCGMYGSLSEASLEMAKVKYRYEPDCLKAAAFSLKYGLWKESYANLKDTFRKLSRTEKE